MIAPERRPGDVPMPIVNLARGFHVLVVVVAFILHLPWLIGIDFVLIVTGLLGGPRWNIFGYIGRSIFTSRLKNAEVESAPLARFNNGIAAVLFALALTAFALHLILLGWIFSAMVALAAALALCGFCFGCFLFYHFRL